MNVVISPHLDDAVFSCGDWLATHPGAIVMTVFAGVPRDGALHTEWDNRCGFADASHAILARRAGPIRRRPSTLPRTALETEPRLRRFWRDGPYG